MPLLPSDWRLGVKVVDDRRLLYCAKSEGEAVAFAAAHFATAASNAITERGAFFAALAGGKTPEVLYSKLALSPYREEIDWTKVHLFWSDERCVPPTDFNSNYRMSMAAGLRLLPLLSLQVHRMRGELPVDKSAKSYEEEIIQHVPQATFDLIMLGLGEDGHTASLFPESTALKEVSSLVVGAEASVPPRQRLTMTLPCIQRCRQAVFYVLGEKKASMLRRVLIEKEPLPAGLIGTAEHPALWIVDNAAAKLIC